MKKLFAIVMAVVLTLGASSAALAAGNGTDTAPGQAVNFEKGVTTIVTISEEVADPHVTTESKTVTEVRLTDSQIVFGIPVVTNATVTDYDNVVGIITHPQHPWTKNLYATTSTKTTTTPNTRVETNASFEVTYERTVSTYYTIKTTIQHHGSPGSNGKVISDVSEEIVTRVVYGDWTEISATEIADSSYTVETKLADTVVTTITAQKITESDGWIKAEGSPSTAPQTGGAQPNSKGKK